MEIFGLGLRCRFIIAREGALELVNPLRDIVVLFMGINPRPSDVTLLTCLLKLG
jgi:hypothetical protein